MEERAAMTSCDRPACAGEIESGYCNVCGYPPPSSSVAAAAEEQRVSAPGDGSTGTDGGPASGACLRPGCGGTLDSGYCDTCGMAPQDSASVPATPGVPGAPASS